MRIFITSLLVDDQAKALDFYTNKLGFVKKADVTAGEYRWLTVISPEGAEGIELVLEPNANPASQTYQKALLEQGIPMMMFASDDVEAEYKRLSGLGVEFKQPPMQMGPSKTAQFYDTCGNLIQISQLPKE